MEFSGVNFRRAVIHVRRQNRNAHALTFADENRNLVRVVDFVAEQSGHELDRIIRLQIRGLIADQAVGRAVALVESVAGEFFQQIENRVRFLLRDFVRRRATFDEVGAFLRHLLAVLFSHRAAQQIRLA